MVHRDRSARKIARDTATVPWSGSYTRVNASDSENRFRCRLAHDQTFSPLRGFKPVKQGLHTCAVFERSAYRSLQADGGLTGYWTFLTRTSLLS